MAANGHSRPEDPERARRLLAVLDQALDAPRSARRAVVRRALVEDPEGQAEVFQWLEHAEAGQGELPAAFDLAKLEIARSDAAAEKLVSTAFRPGDTFKKWTVVKAMDRTAASEVYEGVGADGHRVVIKVVLAARWSPEAARRSRLEAYVLSMVDAPGVVKYIDDGVVDEGPAIGLPYIVTALAEGEHADLWSNRAKASSAQIVEMIARAADAVYQANLHGAVHRDLKPSNIIVRGPAGDPSVVVIDFGVASMEATAVARDSLLSLQSAIVGTAAYMAPEQFLPATHPPDIRCDVYALAAVCYSMLAGRPPHAVEELGIVEAARLKELAPPHLAAVAPLRDTSPGVRRQLSRVLEVALSPRPDARFASCKELSDSLRLALRGLPGTKDRPGPITRARAFAKRQPVLAAAIVVAVLSLLAGTAAFAWQAQVAMAERDLAQQRLEDTQRLARWIMEDLDESLAGLPGSAPLRRRLVEEAKIYLDRLHASLPRTGSDASRPVRLDIVEARVRLGDVLGNSLFVNLGDTDAAAAEYRSALRDLAALGSAPDDARVQWLLGRCYEGLAMCLHHGDPEYAVAHRRARDHYDRACSLEPTNVDLHADRARSRISHAWSSIYPDYEWSRALPGLSEAVDLARAAVAMDTGRVRSQCVLARCLRGRGECLALSDEFESAIADLEEALRVWREAERPGEPRSARMLREYDTIAILSMLARTHGLRGDRARAEPASREALALARRMFEVDRESQTMARALEMALQGRALSLAYACNVRREAGEPLTSADAQDLAEGWACIQEAQALHEARHVRGQMGPGEDYRAMFIKDLEFLEGLLAATAVPPP